MGMAFLYLEKSIVFSSKKEWLKLADWMENVLIVRAEKVSLEKWNRVLLEESGKVGKLSFEKLMPLSEEESDWYRWCMENWGVKWELHHTER